MEHINKKKLGGLVTLAVIAVLVYTANLGVRNWSPANVFEIKMKVNFGPAQKPAYEGAVEVEAGMSPKEVVSLIFPIRSGFACCSYRDLVEIDGVANEPTQNRWWICTVNGNRKITSPYGTKLQPGDTLEWNYIEDQP